MSLGKVRRPDRAMDAEGCKQCLIECTVGHMGTVGPEGMPYVTPMNYAYDPESNRVYLHHSPRTGHLLTNLEHSYKACFQVEQAGEVHRFIRGRIERKYSGKAAAKLRIQYGGSVKPDNAKELLADPDIDGALVGGASLKVEQFDAIIRAAAPYVEPPRDVGGG